MSTLKRKAYDASFKLKVVQFAINCGNNRKTAAEFGISEKQVRDWKKIADELTGRNAPFKEGTSRFQTVLFRSRERATVLDPWSPTGWLHCNKRCNPSEGQGAHH
jgi:transposase-like protein